MNDDLLPKFGRGYSSSLLFKHKNYLNTKTCSELLLHQLKQFGSCIPVPNGHVFVDGE